MEIIKEAQLVDVQERDGKITMSFLDTDRVFEVKWNKKVYDNTLNDWAESKEKEEKVEEWCNQYFGCKTKDLKK